MKQGSKLLTIIMLVIGVLSYASLAMAKNTAAATEVPPTLTEPPNMGVTITIGKRMPQAEEALEQWQEELVRNLADYDAYSPSITNSGYVIERLKYCKDDRGNALPYCKYTQAGVGDDVLASTFIDTRAYETDKDAAAAYQYIKNVTNPVPGAFPDEKELFNSKGGLTEKGVSFFATLYKKIPQLTLAQNSFLAIWSDRARLQDFGKDLPVGKDGKASMMEMLYYEVERRYMNEDWYKQMNTATNEALLREIANMIAFQSYLELKRYEQMSRVEALLAAQGSVFGALNSELMGMSEAEAKMLEEQGETGGSEVDSQSQLEGSIGDAFSGVGVQ